MRIIQTMKVMSSGRNYALELSVQWAGVLGEKMQVVCPKKKIVVERLFILKGGPQKKKEQSREARTRSKSRDFRMSDLAYRLYR